MSVLLIGDPHIKIDNVEATEQMLREIVELILERKPMLVVVLGDVLHTHDKISVGPLVRAIRFLDTLRNVSPHLVVLIGNHDRPNNAEFLTECHPFTALKTWPKTTIVDFPTVITIEAFRFLAIPYVAPGRLTEAVAKIGVTTLQDFSAVFLHQEMKGCHMGPIVSDSEDTWPRTAPMAFSGHIHDFSILQPNFIYVGTPIQHNFGDSTDKAVMFARFVDQKYVDHERCKLRVPTKQQIRLTVEEFGTFVPPTNVILKITILGDPAEIRRVLSLERTKKMLAEHPLIKCTICDTRPGSAAIDTPRTVMNFHDRFRDLTSREPPPVQKICREIGLL